MDHSQLTKSFMELTQATENESKFYLESHNWDLEEAMTTFFSEGNGSSSSSSSSVPFNKPQSTHNTTSNLISSNQPPQQQQQPYKAAPKSTARSGGIKGFSDLRGEGDEDNEDNVNWFTGGEKSGLQVQAPKSEKKTKNQLVDDVINIAKQSGAKNVAEFEEENSKPFGGSGNRLGNTSTTGQSSHNPQPRKEARKKIVLWKNGFTFDDGPLRDYTDPANTAFLDDIKNGKLPREIQNLGSDLLVELQDERSEDYKEPPKVMTPFSGGGNKLGSSSTTSNTISNTTQNSTPSSSSSSQTVPFNLNIDDNQPTTSVQIRCSDGSRLIGKFNHTHTISDIRKFIDSSKPKTNYDLCFSFPQKVITDESQTISAAGLVNSVVIQKNK